MSYFLIQLIILALKFEYILETEPQMKNECCHHEAGEPNIFTQMLSAPAASPVI